MGFTFTSQTKVFVDANATNGGSFGAGLMLQTLVDGEDEPDEDVELVPAVGVEGAAGFRYKTGGGTINLTENRVDLPLVNWRRWRKERKKFSISAQDENNGVRQQWIPVTVAKVSRTFDAEGKHVDKIVLKYLRSYV